MKISEGFSYFLFRKKRHRARQLKLFSRNFPAGKWSNFTLEKESNESSFSKSLRRENKFLNLKIPGVYAFKVNKKIVYIGQTQNIQIRLETHFSLDSFSKKHPTFKKHHPLLSPVLFRNYLQRLKKITIVVRPDKERSERLMIEERMIRRIKPRFNKSMTNKIPGSNLE